jgi:hypothetical protein
MSSTDLPSSVYRLLELLANKPYLRHSDISQDLRKALELARNRGLIESENKGWGQDALRFEPYREALNPAYWLSHRGKDELALFQEQTGESYSGIRLHLDDIDSFQKVRDVSSAHQLLTDDGYFDRSEDDIQRALEDIIGERVHKKDWGGELNDLYTSYVKVKGARIATAFLLKGHGLRERVMTIASCGKRGDQLVRLLDSPAQLFVVQFVGTIHESLIRDLHDKIEHLRLKGMPACYCVINGQDTARLLVAYGKA